MKKQFSLFIFLAARSISLFSCSPEKEQSDSIRLSLLKEVHKQIFIRTEQGALKEKKDFSGRTELFNLTESITSCPTNDHQHLFKRVELLLALGAHPLTPCADGLTPMQTAKASGNKRLLELFKAAE